MAKKVNDAVAERLKRFTANEISSGGAGSNPVGISRARSSIGSVKVRILRKNKIAKIGKSSGIAQG